MMIRFIRLAMKKKVFFTALRVAWVVGIILNLINQGDQMMSGNWDAINYGKASLTFFVPYAVSTYSSVKVLMESE